jgi:conjugal transfer pilin signal peptidase TrbI
MTQASDRREVNRVIFWGLMTFWAVLIVMTLMHNRIALDLQPLRCLPWRVYWLDPGMPREINRGDILYFIPGELMRVPGLKPEDQPFEYTRVSKIVAGLPGDEVEVWEDDVLVNGRSIAEWIPEVSGIPVKQKYIHPITSEKLGKEPQDFVRAFVVPEGAVFMVATEERSFDGRYWGVLPLNRIMGRAYGLF